MMIQSLSLLFLLVGLTPLALCSSITVKQLLHVNWPVGSGPIFTSGGVTRHATSTPTAVFAQFLNSPVEVTAYNASSGGHPIWTLPHPASDSTQTFFTSASARHAFDGGGVEGAVDTIALFAEYNWPSQCTLYGMATTGAGAYGAKGGVVWSKYIPDCADGGEWGQWRAIDWADDGSLAVVQLFLSGDTGNRTNLLLGLNGATGEEVWRAEMAPNSGGYGVMVADGGEWVVTGVDTSTSQINRTAHVLSTRTGEERAQASLYWNIPPGISAGGEYLVGGGSASILLYAWDAPLNNYTLVLDARPPPSAGIHNWLPVDLDVSSYGDRHYIGATFIDLNITIGRFVAWDLELLEKGDPGALVCDSLLDNDNGEPDLSIVRASGRYFAVGTWGGYWQHPEASQFLFMAGQLAPLWNFTSEGGINGLDLVHTATSASTDTLYVGAAGCGSFGGGGNGGDAYFWEMAVTP